MSYESDDSRIGRLEDRVAELIQIQKETPQMFRDLQTISACLVQMFILLKNDHVALLRFLMSSSLIGNAQERRPLLDQVSRLESNCEKLEAQVARLAESDQGREPGSPPADGPELPGC